MGYDVFISYRHTPADTAFSGQLHELLETFRMPENLKAVGYKDVQKVFRDEEELPLKGVLSDTIKYALENSNCLVVVCSRETPVSEWVKVEISTFIKLGKAGRIFALLIDGTPQTSFPEPLFRIPDIAERTIYINTFYKKQKNYELQNARLKIMACALACPYERLLKETGKNNFHKKLKIAAGVFVLALLLISYCTYQLQAANKSRTEANKEKAIMIDAVSNITYGITKDTDVFSGLYDEMAQTLDDNSKKLTEIINLSGRDITSVTLKTHNYINLAGAWQILGSTEKALEYAEEGIKTVESYSTIRDFRDFKGFGNFFKSNDIYTSSEKLGEDLAAAYLNLPGKKLLAQAQIGKATVLIGSGEYIKAVDDLNKALEIYDMLTSVGESTKSTFVAKDEYAALCNQLGQSYLNALSFKAARKYCTKAIDIYNELIDQGDGARYYSQMGDCYENLGTTYTLSGDNKNALPNLKKGLDFHYKAYDSVQNSGTASSVANNSASYAAALTFNNQFSEAAAEIEKAYDIWEAYEDTNSWLSMEISYYLLQQYALACTELGDYNKSFEILSYLQEELEKSQKSDNRNITTQYRLTQVYYLYGYTYMLMSDSDSSKAYLDKIAEPFIGESDTSSNGIDFRYKKGSILIQSSLLAAYSGDLQSAIKYVKTAAGIFQKLVEEVNNKASKAKYLQASAICSILENKDCLSAGDYIVQARELDPESLDIKLWTLYLEPEIKSGVSVEAEIKKILDSCPYMIREINRNIAIFNELGLDRQTAEININN